MKSFFYLFSIISLSLSSQSWAFDWNELWQTPDQKAQVLMNKGRFAQAEATFDNIDWKALAAFRAGHYKKAASLYAQLKTNDYNRGNALAHAGQLQAAIQAYDKALANNPNDHDAIFNRKIVEKLLKKQQKQNKSDQTSNDQERNNQKQQDNKQKGPDKKDQQDQKNQARRQDEEKRQDKTKRQQSEQDKKSTQKSKQESNQSREEQEQQQAKKQWLKLIPDDPGGLMREKFLRDYLRRQQR
jgi:Ca-activated chloride channel homolog